MESTAASKLTIRQGALADWITSACGMNPDLLQPLAGDASFRRYFRLPHRDSTYVVMDAPPPENVRAFSAVAHTLRQAGLKVPEIFQADLNQGFLLLSDFGDLTYLKANSQTGIDARYEMALQALAILQTCRQENTPPFTADFMWQEWAWHKEWFAQKFLGLSELDGQLDDCYAQLVAAAVAQPQVFMHRDYHSANLMVLPDHDVGILDFQDAFIGPVTYDLVSLLRDCYVTLPADKVTQWALAYKEKLQLNISSDEFLYWFDHMGMQRHLKALMTFARKQVRDQQAQYLQHMPRTLDYLLTVSAKYPALAALRAYLQNARQEIRT